MTDLPKTPRGFIIWDDFTDLYGNSVTVQESSLATEYATWVFVGEPNEGTRMAAILTNEQALRLAIALLTAVKGEAGDV